MAEYNKKDGSGLPMPVSPHVNLKGMTVWATALIIVGEMAGGGLIAMPGAVKHAGWLGIPLLFIGAVLTGYTGAQLGSCWTMLQERWPQYRDHTRKPYQEIARRATGVPVMHITSFCVDFTLFGASVAFLVVSAENISDLLNDWFNVDFSFCFLILILGVLLWPLTFLGTPKDFWFLVVGACGATTVATILLIIGMAIDVSKTGHYDNSTNHTTNTVGVPISEIGFKPFWLGFGTILFAYGGHSAFPVIQHDMKKPSKFSVAVLAAYLIIVALYVPTSVFGFLAYGENVNVNNIIENIGTEWCQTTVFVLITIHVLLTFILICNPVTQEIEEIFHIPHGFGWKRVVVRTCYMVLVIFVAESVPRFGLLLSLIGSSTITCLTFIFPGIFYISLKFQQQKTVWTTESLYPARRSFPPIPWWEFIFNIIIIVIGVIGAIAGTYAAIDGLVEGGSGSGFTPPCYVNGGLSK